ncbi:hypothetical protein GUITHDRAFT_151032 [Guillardia theta CCMP2712]|uniref:Uncharacterized protein n=1 Tax=Guillardia theta (strain CCMP2712) TaxID=905079 RepID=L1JSN4_GUITC|nr:hypothetical protein GUITHDRAFT_151032 [Guillardia theta CCMP2712]EKX51284.1 hypothetical protein GUITHDRAFT_151032 [Guillardia theta CCMP2712]|eukprot:XP_005838264.1 hypothetical protein GUITHDRAFT_151032 [Guillardia theta CCMP2712]
MIPEQAVDVWRRGAESLLDCLLLQPAHDGDAAMQCMWHAVQALHGIAEHAFMREAVAGHEYAQEGGGGSTMKALRYCLRHADEELTVEISLLYRMLARQGGLKELVDILMEGRDSEVCLRNCARVLQSLCSKLEVKAEVCKLTKMPADQIGRWTSRFIYGF